MPPDAMAARMGGFAFCVAVGLHVATRMRGSGAGNSGTLHAQCVGLGYAQHYQHDLQHPSSRVGFGRDSWHAFKSINIASIDSKQ